MAATLPVAPESAPPPKKENLNWQLALLELPRKYMISLADTGVYERFGIPGGMTLGDIVGATKQEDEAGKACAAATDYLRAFFKGLMRYDNKWSTGFVPSRVEGAKSETPNAWYIRVTDEWQDIAGRIVFFDLQKVKVRLHENRKERLEAKDQHPRRKFALHWLKLWQQEYDAGRVREETAVKQELGLTPALIQDMNLSEMREAAKKLGIKENDPKKLRDALTVFVSQS